MSTSIDTIMGDLDPKRLSGAQAAVLVDAIRLVAESVRIAEEIPSGHLYAHLLGIVSLDVYQRIVDMLVRAELVAKKGDLLVWVGPEISK